MKIDFNVDIAGLLLVAFIVLKLTNVIAWSWWWVLSPLWIGIPVGLLVLGVFIIMSDHD